MSVVYIVHCIDTEGPLHESLDATFERIQSVWGIELEASEKNLKLLQQKKIDLNGVEDAVAVMVAPDLLAYNNSWEKIDLMLSEILSEGYRCQTPDSFGNGWIYNWFLVDHVGYTSNPRERDIGYHRIFDHYLQSLNVAGQTQDGVHFHYHPMPISGAANHCATSYFGHSDTLFQSLARRIIDRHWFPCAYRPGFHATRPDSHWFLEQFIPIDYANQSCEEDQTSQPDLGAGRFGDWRRAPLNWQPYHPDHDDYQIPGNCRRTILRCLNVGTRLRLLKQTDVDQAFEEAEAGKPVVMGFTHHDYRDMRPDIDQVRKMLNVSAAKFPSVKFKYSEARDAFRQALGKEVCPPISLNVEIENNRLHVFADRPTFGPQPFLALKTVAGDYYHDNFDFQRPFYEWTYTFDEHNLPLADIEAIGVATCDTIGNVTVAVLNPHSEKLVLRCI